jgi:hypothetical protein
MRKKVKSLRDRMGRKAHAISRLRLMCGCRVGGDPLLCGYPLYHFMCEPADCGTSHGNYGSTATTQDSPSSIEGVRDEKPDRTFPEYVA